MDQVGDQDRPAEGDDGELEVHLARVILFIIVRFHMKSKGDMEAFNAHMT